MDNDHDHGSDPEFTSEEKDSTMHSAYERSYRVVTLTDCTATLSEEEQRMATEKDFAMFSQPMTHRAFLEGLAAA